jgi:hypothetical protein
VVDAFLAPMYCLEKPEVPVCQIELFSFGRQNICFSCFNFCEALIICIMYYLFTHIFIAPLGCIDIRELYWIFLKNVQNDIYRPNLNSIQYAHI